MARGGTTSRDGEIITEIRRESVHWAVLVRVVIRLLLRIGENWLWGSSHKAEATAQGRTELAMGW